MAEVKIVVVGGVRYREEDAPKKGDQAEETTTEGEVEHKMRKPAPRARRTK